MKVKTTESKLAEKYLHISNGGITHSVQVKTYKDDDGERSVLVSRVSLDSFEASSTVEATLNVKGLRSLAKLYSEAADKAEKLGIKFDDDFAAK